MWENTHPKLYELYELSQNIEMCENLEKNYFQNFEKEINHPLSEERLKLLENDLSRLDSEAWNNLKNKLNKTKCFIKPSKERYWEKLSDFLNEIKGYIYLQDAGYEKIQYIKEDNGKTPDFYAIINNYKSLLEVKTINISDIEANYRSPNTPIRCRNIEPGINEKLKSQIIKKINEAQDQLISYSSKTNLNQCKLFIMICINFDDRWKGLEQNFQEFEQIIKVNKPKNVEKIIPMLGYQL